MSDFSNIWQGIGLLGQTKKGMYTPMIDAYRNRGKVVSEGLGRISDTIGGIANRRKTMKFQTGETEKQQKHEIAMQTSEQDYQANQAVLNRALERDKIWASLFEGTQDRDAMRKEAAADRQLQRDLQAAAESATNARQKAELEEMIRQFDIKVGQWKDEFDREGLQWEDDMGLRGRELDIRGTEASARMAALQHELELEKADPKVAAAYRTIMGELKLDRPELFLGVDDAGYQYEKGLRELTSAEKKELSSMFDDRVTTDYNDIRDGLFRLFNGAMGSIEDTQAVEDSSTSDALRDKLTNPSGEDEERKEAVSILKDWLSQPAFGGNIKNWLQEPAFGGDIVEWLKEPVLGYRDQDVGKMLYQLADKIPDIIGRGGAERANPDQTTVDNYILELTSGNATTRRLQEIAKELKSLKEKYSK